MPAIRFRNLQIGDSVSGSLLQFSDNFNTPGASWGPNWLEVFWTTFAGAAAGAQVIDPTVNAGNQGFIQQIGGLNATAVSLVLIPIPVFQNLYNQPRTFSKCTWVTSAVGNIGSQLILRFNSEQTNGTGLGEADFYELFLDQGLGGLVQRVTGASLGTTLQAATWLNPAANDVFEFRATDNGVNVTLQTFQNNILISTIVDAVGGVGGRITKGSPAFKAGTNGSAAGSSVTIDNYSCGVF
jgi:hypothetical protein